MGFLCKCPKYRLKSACFIRVWTLGHLGHLCLYMALFIVISVIHRPLIPPFHSHDYLAEAMRPAVAL